MARDVPRNCIASLDLDPAPGRAHGGALVVVGARSALSPHVPHVRLLVGGLVSDKCTQGHVQQPQRSGLVLRTSAKARARPRVVVAVHEYLEQNTAVGAVWAKWSRRVSWRKSAGLCAI